MKWIVLTGFLAFALVKIKVLGINGAGAVTMMQLAVTYGLDRWKGLRDIKNDPYIVTYDDYGKVVWVPRGTAK